MHIVLHAIKIIILFAEGGLVQRAWIVGRSIKASLIRTHCPVNLV